MTDDTTRLDDDQTPGDDAQQDYASDQGQSGPTDSAFESLSAIEFSPTSQQQLEQASGHNRIWLILVGVVFILVAAVAGFLFTGKSVAIVVSPGADDVSIDGPWMPLDFGDRWLLHEGRFDLEIALEGYETLNTSIDVTAEAGQR